MEGRRGVVGSATPHGRATLSPPPGASPDPRGACAHWRIRRARARARGAAGRRSVRDGCALCARRARRRPRRAARGRHALSCGVLDRAGPAAAAAAADVAACHRSARARWGRPPAVPAAARPETPPQTTRRRAITRPSTPQAPAPPPRAATTPMAQKQQPHPAWTAAKPFFNGGLSGMCATTIIQVQGGGRDGGAAGRGARAPRPVADAASPAPSPSPSTWSKCGCSWAPPAGRCVVAGVAGRGRGTGAPRARAPTPAPSFFPRLRQFAVAGQVIKEYGVSGLYKGLSAGLLRQATYTTARLGIFNTLSESLKEANAGAPLPLYQKAGAGLAAGGLGALIGSPADLSLIRMQVGGGREEGEGGRHGARGGRRHVKPGTHPVPPPPLPSRPTPLSPPPNAATTRA